MTHKTVNSPGGATGKEEGFKGTGPLTETGPAKKPFRIMFVDDELVIRNMYTRFFSKKYDSVAVFETPAEALEAYKRGGFHAVVSDFEMAGMDGEGFVKAIKKHDPNAKVIVVTGSLDTDLTLRARLLGAGACDVVGKPFSVDDLDSRIAGLFGAKKQATVIVVDDDRDCADTLGTLIGYEGHKVKSVYSGEDALQLFKEGGADLVISDFHMGAMNGDELLAELKALKPDLKVIIQSAEADPNERSRLLDAGAYKVLRKPVDLDELFNIIGEALKQR